MDLMNIICLILSTVTIHFSVADDKTSLVSAAKPSVDVQSPLPSDTSALDKRRWSSFNTWGKRRWDKFGTWGKRWQRPQSPWGKKWSSFATWGKRSGDSTDSQDLQNEQKRTWKAFTTWGKRTPDAEKRWHALATWGKRNWNKFATWGKRGDNDVKDTLMKLFDSNHDGEMSIVEFDNFLAWLASLDRKLR